MKIATIALLLTMSPAIAGDTYVEPQIPSEADKAEALRLGYILNGFSMTRHPSLGSIDVSNYFRPLPAPVTPPVPLPKGRGRS